ncbi:aspartate dehydrogenase domain-containing protein [Rhizobium lusitanum]|uniref:aspartate dehydrogenase domain-containing protein n=1 Tax=Rhizobium lusitanum TaxID=293958 RepID=UPI00195B79F8|nr:aspartate dehydrogenase domain-containing protein [Rhizobium lusitanum]MBM7045522.1 DUF108 domain-containing protein [Rhizobium lusitanum]
MSAKSIIRNEIDLDGIKAAVCILNGTVSDVAREFPANGNVAAAVSLAGLGAEPTQMGIWADPDLTFNTHSVSVQSDNSDFSMSIKNRPSDDIGPITSQSVKAYLRQLHAVLRIGT